MSIPFFSVHYGACRAIGGVAAYFIGGSVYQYYVKGARGQEIVPNINFWKDLPFLIKVHMWHEGAK